MRTTSRVYVRTVETFGRHNLTSCSRQGIIPGCTVDPHLVSRGELFALECMFAQALIFVAFGVGLEPRQRDVIGPAMAPVLVSGCGELAMTIEKSTDVGTRWA